MASHPPCQRREARKADLVRGLAEVELPEGVRSSELKEESDRDSEEGVEAMVQRARAAPSQEPALDAQMPFACVGAHIKVEINEVIAERKRREEKCGHEGRQGRNPWRFSISFFFCYLSFASLLTGLSV